MNYRAEDRPGRASDVTLRHRRNGRDRIAGHRVPAGNQLPYSAEHSSHGRSVLSGFLYLRDSAHVFNRPQDFVCRADFCSKMTQEKKGGLYVFTYTGDGNTAPERFHLRSEHLAVILDTSTESGPSS